MQLPQLVKVLADALKELDTSLPAFKTYGGGIGPYGEPQLINKLSEFLTIRGMPCRTRRTPDLIVGDEWGLEIKIVRPFGDNGFEAEDWSINMLHPYPGNMSSIGDAYKLAALGPDLKKAVFVIGYEHLPAKISLDPLFRSFEVIASAVCNIALGPRVEERRANLIHDHHKVVRCVSWEILNA